MPPAFIANMCVWVTALFPGKVSANLLANHQYTKHFCVHNSYAHHIVLHPVPVLVLPPGHSNSFTSLYIFVLPSCWLTSSESAWTPTLIVCLEHMQSQTNPNGVIYPDKLQSPIHDHTATELQHGQGQHTPLQFKQGIRHNGQHSSWSIDIHSKF